MAVAMASATLEEHVAAGTSEAVKRKKGVLAAALRYFARRGGGGIEELIGLLSDLPEEGGGDITGSRKLAASMADGLRAALQTDPLMQGAASVVKPATLFGLGSARTRISVISLIGLPTAEAQGNFVNQLAMALFSWIRKHPSQGAHGLTGLLVIDEAKDFLPAVNITPSKQSLMLLAAQARKYGLGMVLATQNPKDVDYKAVAQFSTQFFGRANSPQVIEFVKGLISEKGGSAEDIARLQKGQFYMVSESFPAPIKVAVPMCLSYHPDGKPLTENEILSKAARNRETDER
jgi:DNA helicase HerA-like ATPase